MLAQVPWPAQALSLPRPRFLQEFNPRQVCGSSVISFSASESATAAPAGSAELFREAGGVPQPIVVPATMPLRAATVSR